MDERERTQVDADLPGRGEDAAPARGPLRLVVVGGAEVGRRHLVEDTATLGRSSRSSIVIADPFVSRDQARIERSPDGAACLVDVSGRGTTRLNGRLHTRGPLYFGDKIEVGNTVLLVTPHDVTEEIELEQDRIKALGYLSAGVAHDLNNMLGVIQSTLAYLGELEPGTRLDDPGVRECLDDVATAVGRSSQLVGRILGFARQEKESHELLDLAEIVEDVLKLASRGFPRNIRIERRVGRDLWVRGDRAQLSQLLMNLCINARDAMPTGGVLEVRATSDGRHVKLFVKDTGVGMDAATRERIFERYFTTKAHHGTGLGLTTVVEVARWHGGSVSVDSEPGRGAHFVVTLPHARPRASVSPRSLATPAPQRRPARGRILLADRDAVSRRSAARLLRQWGYEVTEVGDAEQAISAFASSLPDVVLVERELHTADGRELWADLLQRDPQASVALVSGRAAEGWEEHYLAGGALGVLEKPLEAPALRAFVEAALRSARRAPKTG